MGLDMYIFKGKKIPGLTIEQIYHIEEYIDYLDRPMEKYKNCSFKEWCGGDARLVRKSKIGEVRKYIHTSYSSWDTDHEYGYQSFFDNIAYWRKANAIHNWFIKNCADGIDECQIIPLYKDQLESLLETAEKVKASCKLVKGKINNGYTIEDGKEIPIIEDGEYIEDSSVAEELLPVCSGFFFGSTNYDQWYFADIENTIKQISKILETTDFDNEYVFYKASW